MVKPLAAGEAVRWVSEYLGTYCTPGTHHFATASSATRWCTVCYKEESRADETCMICDLRGAAAGDLTREGSVESHGRLCADCELGLITGRDNGLAPWAFSRDS